MQILGIHHVAIIASNYEVSKNFYTKILGFSIKAEVYREERKSYKLDLEINGKYQIELFSFPNPPSRITQPEACGLRHLALCVENIDEEYKKLIKHGINAEPIRVDEYTGKKFAFFPDPDGLPIELYEI